MAETLNLGTNGNWATKKESLLAYNSENNNFKPLPFNFTRNSSATRVNKEGLIEVVSNNEPRIDFKDNTKGALLLEPSRTNYQPYSTNFSVWSAADVTLSLNYGLSPDGLNNSTLITEGTGSAQHRVSKASPSSSGIYTFSCFVKNKVGNHQAYIDMGTVTGFFNFDTKTMYSAAGTTNVESWSNDWYRISITSNSNVTPIANYIGIGKNNTETFQGDGSSAIEFFGAQLEQGSYATSYIPTNGSAVTRVADACNNGGNEQVINSTEGVLEVELQGLTNGGDSRKISISDDTNDNRIFIKASSISDYWELGIEGSNGGLINDNFSISLDHTLISVIKLKWKSGDIGVKVNGVEVYTNSSTFTMQSLTKLQFKKSSGSGDDFLGKIYDLKIYNNIDNY